jgi:hypothetical protein
VKVVGELKLTTTRLDEILPSDFKHNFLNIDIQGAEYQALKSLGSLVQRFDYIYLEVNKGQVYQGIRQVEEIDRLLKDAGFSRVATIWTSALWGDAFYIKQHLAETAFGGRWGLRVKILNFHLLRCWRIIKRIGAALANEVLQRNKN